MPRGDGTGPNGKGPGTGRGMGNAQIKAVIDEAKCTGCGQCVPVCPVGAIALR
ncbi:4Fe-4S binding protein [bacterium]|nr:4Fe-4S binding protein [bacterium]